MAELEICEVGPRDGLQSASRTLSVAERVSFIQGLYDCGLKKIEVGSLVNPKLVPTMADSDEVFSTVCDAAPTNRDNFSLLIPNEKGLSRALEIGCTSVAFFTATSETFSKKNINRSVGESLEDLRHLMQHAKEKNPRIRLYISTVFDCAYEGMKQPEKDLIAFLPLFDAVDEISLGDTTGKATAQQVKALVESRLLESWRQKLWWHFHDTYALAEDNVSLAMDLGFTRFDSSAGGIGGCPFSPGAKGNVATEKVLAVAAVKGLSHSVRLPLASVR